MVLMRLVSLVVSLVVMAVVGLVVVKPQLDSASDAVRTAVDEVTTTARQVPSVPTAADQPDAGDSFTAANLRAARSALVAKIGAGGDLLEVSINGQYTTRFTYRKGDGASGYEWKTGGEALQPFGVKLIGSGDVRNGAFPVKRFSAAAPARIAKAMEAKGVTVTAMTLRPNPATGELQWAVPGETDARVVTYSAKPDGSGLALIG